MAVKMVLELEPVREGGEARRITRVATVWCAQKSVNDASDAVAASQAAETQAAAGG
jgi:hypothetical protein